MSKPEFWPTALGPNMWDTSRLHKRHVSRYVIYTISTTIQIDVHCPRIPDVFHEKIRFQAHEMFKIPEGPDGEPRRIQVRLGRKDRLFLDKIKHEQTHRLRWVCRPRMHIPEEHGCKNIHLYSDYRLKQIQNQIGCTDSPALGGFKMRVPETTSG